MTNGLRAPHEKSRNGCYQCKKRHVKCNRVAPFCAHCTRRKEQCSYSIEGNNPFPNPSKYDLSMNTLSSLTDSRQYFELSPFTCITLPLSLDPYRHVLGDPSNPEYELMVHYIKYIAPTLPLRDDLHNCELWSLLVPAMASETSWVRQSMLAVSALNLCELNPEKYYEPACYYSVECSTSFRTQVDSLSPSIRRDMTAFALNSTIIGFTMYFVTVNLFPEHAATTPFNPYEVIASMRATGSLVPNHRRLLTHSAILKEFGGSPEFVQIQDTVENFLTRQSVLLSLKSLREQVKPRSSSPTDNENKSISQIYSEAIDTLVLWINENKGVPIVWRQIFVWPSLVSEEYMERLKLGCPMALEILGHFCVIIGNQTPERWYLQPWLEKVFDMGKVASKIWQRRKVIDLV